MEKVPFAIVGCVGMGGRHLLGLKELADSGLNNVELIAACDVRQDNAEHLADEAQRLLGYRPRVFGELGDMVSSASNLQAVAITTDAASHHAVAVSAFHLGLHVVSEKPLGLTMHACNCILEAQQRSGKLLSVAENYRRDPMSRLTRALIDSGAIGTPEIYLDISTGGGSDILITPWRHMKDRGGMLLDGGVHNADMMLYYMGDIQEVYARTALWQKKRYKPKGEGGVSGFYQRWASEMPEEIEATAEDTVTAIITFKNGVMGQWTQSYGMHGQGFGQRMIYGSQGSLIPGGTRNGVSPVLKREGQPEMTGAPLLDLVPDFHLDEITACLFGADRLASYSIPFPAADRKLLAIEFYEMADCIIKGTTPEVDGQVGRRAVAMCYSAFESGVQNRPISLDEIETEQAGTYESDINLTRKI
jgi:predicted dehydrogenase